jgi:hypothetical protein
MPDTIVNRIRRAIAIAVDRLIAMLGRTEPSYRDSCSIWFKRGHDLVQYEAREISRTQDELTILGPDGPSASNTSRMRPRCTRVKSHGSASEPPTAGLVRMAGISNSCTVVESENHARRLRFA